MAPADHQPGPTGPSGSSGPASLDDRVARLEARDKARDSSGRSLVRRFVATVVVVCAVAGFGTWRAEQAGDTATAAVASQGRETVDRQVEACSSTNDFRRLFRDYLATQGQGLAPSSVLELPGFASLEPATQEYVRALVALLNSGSADAKKIRDEYVSQFPLRDCTDLRRTLEAALADDGT